MKLLPTPAELQPYLNHYWVIQDVSDSFASQKLLYAFPGLTPEMIIILDGQLTYHYLGKQITTRESTFFGFLHGDIYLDFSRLKRFIVVVFQAHALAAVSPFLRIPASDLIQTPIQPLSGLFPDFNASFLRHLSSCAPPALATALDGWLLRHYRAGQRGFFGELIQDMPPDFQLKTLREKTNYSVSSLERYFKKDTGLRPKQYQRLYRFRGVIEQLYLTRNADWGAYVDQFGFFDQSHFIKEVRAFTGATPSQLLRTPGIFPYRPK